jgi:NAD(P)H-dependent flavin oxidoreductase YrpB (nitropropane dioxygenase family)
MKLRDQGLIASSGAGSSTKYFDTAKHAHEWQTRLAAAAEQSAHPKRPSFAQTCEAVRQAIIQAGDAGITTPEIAAIVKRDNSSVRHCISACQLGHSARFGNRLLHFATPAQAKAYSAAPEAHQKRHKPKKPAPAAAPTAPTVLAVTSAALPAPVRVAIQQLQGQARWGDDMKVIIAPQPQPRINTAGAEPVFSSMQPLEYLPERTWASSYLEART